jgi:hypothetical protein
MTVNLTERIHVTNEINDIDDATQPQESVKVLAGDDLKKMLCVNSDSSGRR